MGGAIALETGKMSPIAASSSAAVLTWQGLLSSIGVLVRGGTGHNRLVGWFLEAGWAGIFLMVGVAERTVQRLRRIRRGLCRISGESSGMPTLRTEHSGALEYAVFTDSNPNGISLFECASCDRAVSMRHPK